MLIHTFFTSRQCGGRLWALKGEKNPAASRLHTIGGPWASRGSGFRPTHSPPACIGLSLKLSLCTPVLGMRVYWCQLTQIPLIRVVKSHVRLLFYISSERNWKTQLYLYKAGHLRRVSKEKGITVRMCGVITQNRRCWWWWWLTFCIGNTIDPR